MSIKSVLVRTVEKLSGKTCRKCRHNHGGRCVHPDGKMFIRCWNSCTRPGFEDRHNTSEQVYIDAIWEPANEKTGSGQQEE